MIVGFARGGGGAASLPRKNVDEKKKTHDEGIDDAALSLSLETTCCRRGYPHPPWERGRGLSLTCYARGGVDVLASLRGVCRASGNTFPRKRFSLFEATREAFWFGRRSGF